LLSVAADSPAPAVHLGWGSFRNLDIVAARRSGWALLLDVNVHQFRVWEAVGAALRDPAARDPAAFIERLIPRLPSAPRLRQFSDSTRRWLEGDLERPGSWLFVEDAARFHHVRRLFVDDRVVCGCLDLRGGRAGLDLFPDLAQRMHVVAAAGYARFETLYVSNIPWMLAQPRGFFDEAHGAHAADPEQPVLRQVRRNLAQIAPYFRHVLSARGCAIGPRRTTCSGAPNC
jgi:hypothetical protein